MSGAGDIAGGAVQGAAIGTQVLPGVGTAVGAVIGAVAGLFKSKSKKKARKAQQIESQMADIQDAVMRRQQLREAFIARSTALAAGAAEEGGLESSTVQGALGSLGSQLGYNTRYFDTQRANISLRNRYKKDAAKYADYAGVVEQVGNAAASIYGRRPRSTPAAPSRAPGQYDAPWGVLGDPDGR